MTTTPEKRKPGRSPRHSDKDWERTGATLRQLRYSQDITREAMAEALGFERPSSITQIELGFRPLTDAKLIKAARFLNVPPLAIRRPETDATENDQ